MKAALAVCLVSSVLASGSEGGRQVLRLRADASDVAFEFVPSASSSSHSVFRVNNNSPWTLVFYRLPFVEEKLAPTIRRASICAPDDVPIVGPEVPVVLAFVSDRKPRHYTLLSFVALEPGKSLLVSIDRKSVVDREELEFQFHYSWEARCENPKFGPTFATNVARFAVVTVPIAGGDGGFR